MCKNSCKKGSGKCCSAGCMMSQVGKVLVIIGGINWGLVGLGMLFGSSWNLVNILVGSWSMLLEAVIYVLVGLAAVMSICGCKCKTCMGGVCSSSCKDGIKTEGYASVPVEGNQQTDMPNMGNNPQ